MIIWLLTIGCNVFLAFLLLFRGHWVKYKVLLAALIYAVMASPVLMSIYHHYGTNSRQYDIAYRVDKLALIFFNLGIIFEAWRWRNRCVRLPQELYVGLTLCAFLTEKCQYSKIADFMYCSLWYGSIVITCWYIFTFLPEVNHERRQFGTNRRTDRGNPTPEEAAD